MAEPGEAQVLERRPTEVQVCKESEKRGLTDLWMIIATCSRVIRCYRVKRSARRLRFQVGKGVQLNEGDHCELLSNRPGESTPVGMDVPFNRGATICCLEESDEGGNLIIDVVAKLDER